MEKQNPLLPFAFTSSSFNDNNLALNTTPRERAIIDENAKSIYHTRVSTAAVGGAVTTNSSHSPAPKKNAVVRPTLRIAPSLKRRMGESFNENDDIKRRDVMELEFSEQPTEIDDEEQKDELGEDEFQQSNIDSESHSYLPPSSPPIEPPMSEFEFTTNTISNYNIPESPPDKLHHRDRIHLLPSEIELDHHHFQQDSFFKPTQIKKSQSYSPQKTGTANDNNLSSDVDFGIDKFHRFKTSINFPSSSTDFDEIELIRQQGYTKARSIILDAFEDIQTIINLERLNLYEIPDEIKDLNKIVVFDNETDDGHQDKRKYQLFLTNNNLYDLTPSLFKFTKLNVLGLRQNKLRYLPPLISKLINLTDLSLGTNKLTFLPYQILQLNNLQIFQAGPNPFLKIPTDAIRINNTNDNDDTNSIRQLNFISKLSYLSAGKVNSIPSLKSLCLDKIARYDVSYQETKDWKKFTPKLYHNLIIKAIKSGKYQEYCCQCSNIVVDPVAEIFEWWDYLQNKNIPIRKQFCSGGCIMRYEHYNSLT